MAKGRSKSKQTPTGAASKKAKHGGKAAGKASSEVPAGGHRAPRDPLEGKTPELKSKGVSLPLLPPELESAENDIESDVDYSSVENIAALTHVKIDLERYSLLRDLIYGVPRAISPEECQAWISWGENHGFEAARQAASAGYAHRDNGRISVHSPEIAAVIFQRLRGVVPPEIDGRKAVGCSPNIRLYRYIVGQRFGKHIDESNFEEELQAWSEFTLLFYLNDEDLEGGETVFYSGNTGTKEALRVPPQQGLALLHWHGDRCLVHEGANVRSGVKYLLRSDVLYQ